MENLYLWPEHPGLSLLVLVALSMAFLYFAREPMHRFLKTLEEGLGGGLTRVADWAHGAGERLNEKNREVLFEAGLGQAKEKIDHEFRRLESSYTKRLAAYPELHLKLDSNVAKIDADYKSCGQVPPEAPGWGDLVEPLVKMKESPESRLVEKMLKEIHKSAEAGQKKALDEYRSQTVKRHKILGGMAPTWREISKLLQKMTKVVTSVLEATAKIDRLMQQFEELGKGGERSIDLLSSRATKLFIFSLIVIAVATGGAFINFQLIALPMSELVPAGARIMGMPVAEIAALVIVTLEIVVGIFLMESIGITSIFPQIDAMNRSNRRIIFFATFGGLFFLASVEASLAILREHLVESEMTLRQSLAGTAAITEAEKSLIPVVGQAVLGFVLPWILAMVAVPLEILIEGGQYVAVKLTAMLVSLFGHIFRILAYLVELVIKLAGHIFDIYIVVPVQLEKMRQSAGTAEQLSASGSGKDDTT